MRSVLRLVWTYFTSTPLVCWLSAIGTGFILLGIAGYLLLPVSLLTSAMHGDWSGDLPLLSIVLSFLAIGLPWFGMILLLAATALMPAIVEQIALGRSIWVLPGGRMRLLASVLLTALLLAALIAAAAATAFTVFLPWGLGSEMFFRTLVMAFIDLGLLYTAIWLVGKTQGIWRLAGTLWAIISITIPLRLIGARDEPFSWLEWLGIAGWLVFAALLLSGGRMRHSLRQLKGCVIQIVARFLPAERYQEGKEFDLMLGCTRPWLIAFGQIVPIAAMPFLIIYTESWLAVLMIFSAISGAVTSQAAARSRRFWLRVDRSREQIAKHVELAYWRYNSSSLLVLLVLYSALAIYSGFAMALIIHGCVLLILGSAACTYLGLMITRGLGWFESVLCIITLCAMIIGAIATMRGEFTLAIELEILLAALAIIYRFIALSRWAGLDWMRCRSDAQLRGAT